MSGYHPPDIDTDAQTAALVPFTPAQGLAATDTQAAIAEVAARGNSIFVGGGAFGSFFGTPAFSQFAFGIGAWLLDKDVTEGVATGLVYVPPGWTTFDAFAWWAPTGAAAGTSVRVQLALTSIVAGAVVTAGNISTGGPATKAANALSTSVVRSQFVTAAAVPASRVMSIICYRLGGDAADTVNMDIGFLGAELVKVS